MLGSGCRISWHTVRWKGVRLDIYKSSVASLWKTEPPPLGSLLSVSDPVAGLLASYKHCKVTWGWNYRQAISTVKLPAQQVAVYIVSVTGCDL